jgi:hypothetical protein
MFKYIVGAKKCERTKGLKPHWSRDPRQVARDQALFRKVGLVFEEGPESIHRMRRAELKDRIVDLPIMTNFAGGNNTEPKRSRKIRAKYYEADETKRAEDSKVERRSINVRCLNMILFYHSLVIFVF